MVKDTLRCLSRPVVVLVALVVLYTVFFSAYQIERYRAFWHEDIVSVEQPIWNTLQGRFMRTTYYPMAGLPVTDFSERRTESLLADHVQPFLLVLALPYALFPRTETLLILMSLTTALGAVPLYAIARRRLGSAWWALAFAGVYLLLPVVETNSVGDLHGLRFLPPLLLAALDAAQRGKSWQWWLWMVLAAGTREDVAFFAGWAMLWLAPAERRREAWIMFGVGTAYSLLCFLVIIPHFGGGGTPYLTRFFPLGTDLTPAGIVEVMFQGRFWLRNVLAFLSYNVRLGLPLLFLYGFHWPALLAAAPLLVLNGVSWFQVALYPNLSHYSAPVVPWICVGAVEGFVVVARWLHRARPTLQWRNLVGEALLVSTVATHVVSGYTPLALRFVWPQVGPREEAKVALLARIPEDAVVSAESHLGTHLARRETMRFFPDLRDAEWVILDFWTGHYFYLTAVERFQDLLLDSDWETVTAGDGLLLLRRGAGPPDSIADAFRPQVSLPLMPLTVQFGTEDHHGLTLQGFDVRARANGHLVLCSDWERWNGGTLTPEISLSGEKFDSLDGRRFYPPLLASPGSVRDCTQQIAIGNRREQDVYLRVRDGAGQVLSVELRDLGAWEGRVEVIGDVLHLHVKF